MLTHTVRAIFEEMKPREEQYIVAKIRERGGTAVVQQDDNALRELLEFENCIEFAKQKTAKRVSSHGNSLRDVPSFEQDAKLRRDKCERTTQHSSRFIMNLKKDLSEDWSSAVDRNMLVFDKKFTVHQQQLRDNLSCMIHQENNRIIRKLSAGPHDRIRNMVSLFFGM